jgi:hypothetical protein
MFAKRIFPGILMLFVFNGYAQYDVLNALPGTWVNVEDDSKMEIWQKTEEGFIGKSIKRGPDGGEQLWESLRIYNDEGELTYEADVRGNEAIVAFRMSFLSEEEVIFSNSTHDFPKHIHYYFVEPNRLKVEVYAQKGEKTIVFNFRKKE